MGHKASGAALALALTLVAGGCWAQANVGELLNQGGQKLSKEDLQKLHEGGVTQSGALGNGTPYSEQHKPDGTLSGRAGPSGQYSLNGNWKIDDAGKLCLDITPTAGPRLNSCSVIWKAGDKYFASLTEEPNAVVRERKYTK